MSSSTSGKKQRGFGAKLLVIGVLLLVLASLVVFANYQYVSRWRFATAWENLERIRLHERPRKRPSDIYEYIGKQPVESFAPRAGVFVERFSWPDTVPMLSYNIYVIYSENVENPSIGKKYHLAVANRAPTEDEYPK